MSAKSQFMRLAEETGIEVEYEPGSHRAMSIGMAYHITLTAPEGKAFRASGCAIDCSLHGCRREGVYELKPDWAALTEELKKIIAAGFEDDAEEDPA